jgi:hypothetical protein
MICVLFWSHTPVVIHLTSIDPWHAPLKRKGRDEKRFEEASMGVF